MTDVSVVVTAHDETVVSGPTIRAVEASIALARERGMTVQPIIALEAPTDRTEAYFAQDRFAAWELHTYAEGEAATGVLTPAAGRFVTLLRAGDLFSENWLSEAAARMDRAGRDGERVIAHPELEIAFDGARDVVLNVAQDSPLFTPYRGYFGGWYDGLRMAPSVAGPGLADARDVATMAAGWQHVVVADTVHFQRRSDPAPAGHPVGAASLAPDLPELAIDRVGRLGR